MEYTRHMRPTELVCAQCFSVFPVKPRGGIPRYCGPVCENTEPHPPRPTEVTCCRCNVARIPVKPVGSFPLRCEPCNKITAAERLKAKQEQFTPEQREAARALRAEKARAWRKKNPDKVRYICGDIQMRECPFYDAAPPDEQRLMFECHGAEECCNCNEGVRCFGD